MNATTVQQETARKVQTPLTELRDSLTEFANRCREACWFGALFRVNVARDIAADVEREQQQLGRAAYAAEQADIEALKLLEDAASDGLQACDMPAVAKACRLIRQSAKKDHEIAEVACV